METFYSERGDFCPPQTDLEPKSKDGKSSAQQAQAVMKRAALGAPLQNGLLAIRVTQQENIIGLKQG